MKYIFSLVYSFTGLCSFALGQTEIPDAKAKSILDEVSKNTKSYSTVKADFTIISAGSDGKTTSTANGTLYKKGLRYKLISSDKIVFCDEKVQTTYNKDDNTAELRDPPDPNQTDKINPSTVLTIYEKGFRYFFEKEEQQSGVTVQIIKLVPTGKRDFHTVRLTVDKLKKRILAVKLIYKDQHSVQINVKNLTPNTDMPDQTFVFNKNDYPGVEIIDLREN